MDQDSQPQTSPIECPPLASDDEGIYFVFGQREAYDLCHELRDLPLTRDMIELQTMLDVLNEHFGMERAIQ
jgi:hypothetical protein